MVSVSWTLDQVVQVRALDRALHCVLGVHFSLILPPSVQMYEWVRVNLLLGVTMQ